MATPAMNTEYPKWLYNGDGEPKLVTTSAEEKELGPGWEVHPDKARAEHIKKVAELNAKSDAEKKQIDEKYAADKAKQEQDLAKQLEASNPTAKAKAAAAAKAKADADAKAKAEADKAAAEAKAKADAAKAAQPQP